MWEGSGRCLVRLEAHTLGSRVPPAAWMMLIMISGFDMVLAVAWKVKPLKQPGPSAAALREACAYESAHAPSPQKRWRRRAGGAHAHITAHHGS